jgi:hypothetical protein
MQKKTIVDQVEVKRDGSLHVRFRKVLEEDDGTITDLGFHRMAVNPGDDVEGTMEGVDNNLQVLGAGGLAQEEKDFIKGVKDTVWTPEVIEAKQAEIAEMKRNMPGMRDEEGRMVAIPGVPMPESPVEEESK